MFSAIQSQKPDKNIESQVDQTLYSWISFLILQINIWTHEKPKYYKKGNITPRNQKMGIQDLRKNVQNKHVKDHDPSNHWPRASFKAYCPRLRAKSREGQCFSVCPVKNTIFLKKKEAFSSIDKHFWCLGALSLLTEAGILSATCWSVCSPPPPHPHNPPWHQPAPAGLEDGVRTNASTLELIGENVAAWKEVKSS